MSIITVTGFTGEQPRIIARLLPPNAAVSAIDTRMDDGGLGPLAAPELITTFPGTPNYKTIYRFLGTWLGWTGVVNAVPGPVAADRLYYTGDGVPKMLTGGTVYNLAVLPPVAAPTAAVTGVGTGEVSSRVYAYTYVTSFGEESEPSPASANVNWQSGQTVTLSGIALPPGPARGVTLQRFYRSQTGAFGAALYFIAERAVSNANFVDTIPIDLFAEVCPSITWNAPPDTLIGLTALPNGMMAAFTGKSLYFCEPYHPHAWPEIYVQVLDAKIVGLGAMGTELVVTTEGQPWRVAGTEPRSMTMEKIETDLPCVQPQTLVDLGYAIAWAAPDGLALARGGGAVGLASSNLFNPLTWRALDPATMRGGHYHGRWVGSYNALDDEGNPLTGALIIDVAGEVSYLVRTAVDALSWYFEISTGDLFYLARDGAKVYRFDPDDGSPSSLYWRSKDFWLSTDDNFGAIMIDSGAHFSAREIAARQAAIAAAIAQNQAMITAGTLDGVVDSRAVNVGALNGDTLVAVPRPAGTSITIGVYADDVRVATCGETDVICRLPGGFRSRKWAIDAYGDVPIDKITMARTVDELKQAQAA